MNEIDRGLRCRGEIDGLRNGLHLGFDWAALGEMLDARATGCMQRGGAGSNDRVILGVDRDKRIGLRCRPQQEAVVVAPLHEPRRDHEDLESSVTVAHEAWDLGARGLAWIGYDDVEGEVGARTLCVAHPAFDPACERPILLVDHRDDGRDPARDRGACAVLEVVEWFEGRR